jgi:type II secretory pathway pseudopilin PulG
MRADRGVSLFETVAALTLVAVTAVSALSAVGAELRTAEKAQHVLVAEALATTQLDRLGLLTDRELLSLPDSIGKGEFDEPLSEYRWETTATPSSDQAGLYIVVITVEWPTGSYTVKSATYRRPVLAPTR